MRALKALVIVMGVLLVGGTVLLVGVILSRLGGKTASVPAPAASSPAPAKASPPVSFGAATLTIPAGATVAETVAAGDRVVLRLILADGAQRLLVVDPASGALLGTIDLRPGR
jgi:hypothetical protein